MARPKDKFRAATTKGVAEQSAAPGAAEVSVTAEEAVTSSLPEETPANVVADATQEPDAVTDEPEIVDADPKGEADEFPRELTVSNNTPTRLSFPLIHAEVDPHSSIMATFKSAAQLQRFLSDAKQICELNGWTDGITVE